VHLDNFIADPELRRFLKAQRLAYQSVLASASGPPLPRDLAVASWKASKLRR